MSLSLLSLIVACSGDTPAPPPAPPPEDEGTLEQLRALGYVDHAELAADLSLEGVVVLDPERAQPGYRLYVSAKDCEAELISAEGVVARRWDGGWGCYNWSNAELGPDGTLYVPSRDERWFWDIPGPDDFKHRRSLLALTFDGGERWRADYSSHHDTHVMPSGELYTLTNTKRRIDAVNPDAVTMDNGVLLLSPEGAALREWSFYDLLQHSDVAIKPVGVARDEDDPEAPGNVDLFHSNAVEVFADPELAARHPLYREGNVMVTLRHQDLILIFDLEAGAPVWRWGRAELDGPHDAQLLPSGNLLIFDNGLRRGWSRVIELDPVSREIVWDYRGEGAEEFYTRGRGSAQRLPNGNTLIADSNNGEAREVTPEGEIVWRFYNPRYAGETQRSTIVRMKHYPAELIEPLLR